MARPGVVLVLVSLDEQYRFLGAAAGDNANRGFGFGRGGLGFVGDGAVIHLLTLFNSARHCKVDVESLRCPAPRIKFTTDENLNDDMVFFLTVKMVHNIENYYQIMMMYGDMGSKWSRRFGLVSSFIFIGFAQISTGGSV